MKNIINFCIPLVWAQEHSHVGEEHISLIQTNLAVHKIETAAAHHPHRHDQIYETELLPEHDNVLVIFTISILALLFLAFFWITDSIPKPKHGLFQHLPDYETL